MQENLTKALASPESPVRRIGSIWKVASPRDAWFRLARYLITSDVEAFEVAVMSVLTSSEPVDDEPSNWFAKRPPAYSEELKQGLVETLILFGVFGFVQTNIRDLEHLGTWRRHWAADRGRCHRYIMAWRRRWSDIAPFG